MGVSALIPVTLDEAAAEGEEGLEGSDDLETPGWAGGRGARYFTLTDCD